MGEIECTKCIYNINNECKIGGWTIPKVGCPDGKAKPMTNADRIRAMTDEELATWIAYRQGCFERQDKRCSKYGTCRDCWFDWLKEECAE